MWLVRWVASYNQEVLSLLVITNGVSHMLGISSNTHVSCALGTRKLLASSWSGSPTRGAIVAFIGGKSCIAAAHLAKNHQPEGPRKWYIVHSCCVSGGCRGATDRRRHGSPTDKWHRHAVLCYGDAIASCKQLTATHQSLSLSLQTRLATTTYIHTYIHTPFSEKKWYIWFSICCSQFPDKFYETSKYP